MQDKRKAAKHPGVRYREHPSRRHGAGRDKYYIIRYSKSVDGKTVKYEEAIGWASEGITADKAAQIRGQIRENIRTGTGPTSLKEMRELAEQSLEARRQQATSDALSRIPLSEISARYLDWAAQNKRSWKTDAIYINKHILPALGTLAATAVTPLHARELRDDLARRYAPATVKNICTTLRRLYNWASKEPHSTEHPRPLFEGKNPVGQDIMPRLDNARIRFLTYEEADALLDAARSCKRHIQDPLALHDAIALALNTGMRKGEILSLCGINVNMKSRTITLLAEHSKDGQRGIIHCNDDAIEVLDRRIALHGSGVLFPGSRGAKHMSRLSHLTKELADELGFNDGVTDPRHTVTFHTLRHTFASWLALNGTDIYVIAELMRHKDISTTKRYAHLIPRHKQSVVNSIGRKQRRSATRK